MNVREKKYERNENVTDGVINSAFHLMTRVDPSFYLFWHSISNKDRMIHVSPNRKHPKILQRAIIHFDRLYSVSQIFCFCSIFAIMRQMIKRPSLKLCRLYVPLTNDFCFIIPSCVINSFTHLLILIDQLRQVSLMIEDRREKFYVTVYDFNVVENNTRDFPRCHAGSRQTSTVT